MGSKRGTLMKNSILFDEYIPLGDSRKVLRFSKYYIIEEKSHTKCHFSHSGSCTRIPYLQILESQRKMHQKSENIFVQITECDAMSRMHANKCLKQCL